MSKFNVGDKVVCVEAQMPRLVSGNTYTVERVKDGGILCLEGVHGGWFASRFVAAAVAVSAQPVTSVNANKAADKKRGEHYDRILAQLAAAGEAGLTSVALEEITAIKAHKRLPELKAKGKVKLATDWLGSPVLRTEPGRRAARVWVLA